MSFYSSNPMYAAKMEAGLGKQIASGLVDAGATIAAVTLLLVCLSTVPFFHPLVTQSTSLQVAVLAGFFAYRFFMLWLFNGTIGMHLLRVSLLNNAQQPLSMNEKVLAACFILYEGVGYYHR